MPWYMKFVYWMVSLAIVIGAAWVVNMHVNGFGGGVLFVFGLFLFAYATMIASLAGRTLKRYAHLDGMVRTFEPNAFTTIGIYGQMRHPMHMGLGLLPLSIALMMGNVGSILAGGWGIAAALLFVLMVEEPETLEKYGDTYAVYMQKVPAWVFSWQAIDRGFAALEKPAESKLRTQE